MTARNVVAEGLGTAFLVAAVIGSGIMADRLTGDGALALLVNTIATGAALLVLITIFAPISGAQFNPVVTLVFVLRGEMGAALALFYVIAQVAGGLVGTVVVHAMFELPLWQVATTIRTGTGQWLAEGVATFGLILTILGTLRAGGNIAVTVAAYITAAYWFTASTSFANPAVALARAFSNTFAGIRPVDLPGFWMAEVSGALIAMALGGWLFVRNEKPPA